MKSRSIKRWICLVVAVLAVAGCDIDDAFRADASHPCGEAQSNANGRWQIADVANCPPPVWGGAMAPMTIDGKPFVVLFGGTWLTGADNEEKGYSATWGWDGASWSFLNPAIAPPDLNDPAMVFDPIHNQIVLFGGTNTAGQGVNLTYTFDGHNWKDRTDYSDIHTNAHTPPPRKNTMMAFDAADGGVVLFGGKTDSNDLTDDVWVWNGATWSKLANASASCDPNLKPCPREHGSLAPDPVTHGVVLFGGDHFGTASSNDTWVWHAGSWAKQSPAHKPGARSYAAFAPLDDNTDILYGGNGNSADAMWSWDGTDWTNIPVCISGTSCAAPGGVVRAQMAALGATSSRAARMTIFGGTSIDPNPDSERHVFGVYDETWSYEPARASTGSGDWLKLQSQGPGSTAQPSGRNEASLATFVDLSTGAFDAILFGGTPTAGGGPLGDTWLWNGTSWSLAGADGTGPPARASAAMAWDNISNNIVLFGGKDGSNNTLSDTWIFNPSTLAWSQVTGLTTSPPARRQAAMASDVPDLGVLLFGGGNSSGTLGDTWVWDGINRTWTQRSVAGPSSRSEAVMGLAPDGSGGYGVVLFGGSNSSGILADTWTWDGSAWTSHSLSTHPSARYESAMASLDDFAVLFGGAPSGGGADLADTWEWNGAAWTAVTPATSPPGRSHAVAAGAQTSATDTSVNVLLFGGSPASVDNDTWRFKP